MEVKVMEWDDIPAKMREAMELPEWDLRKQILGGLVPELAAMSLDDWDYRRVLYDVKIALRYMLKRVQDELTRTKP